MASPSFSEKDLRHREQNPGAGCGQSFDPEGRCGSLIKFSEWEDRGRFRGYAMLQYTCRREPRPVAPAPSTCSLRKSLTWNGVMPERHPPTCAILLSAYQPASTRLFPWTGPDRQVSMDYWLDSSGPWSGQAWILHHPLRQLGRHPSGVPHGGLYSKSA